MTGSPGVVKAMDILTEMLAAGLRVSARKEDPAEVGERFSTLVRYHKSGLIGLPLETAFDATVPEMLDRMDDGHLRQWCEMYVCTWYEGGWDEVKLKLPSREQKPQRQEVRLW